MCSPGPLKHFLVGGAEELGDGIMIPSIWSSKKSVAAEKMYLRHRLRGVLRLLSVAAEKRYLRHRLRGVLRLFAVRIQELNFFPKEKKVAKREG